LVGYLEKALTETSGLFFELDPQRKMKVLIMKWIGKINHGPDLPTILLCVKGSMCFFKVCSLVYAISSAEKRLFLKELSKY